MALNGTMFRHARVMILHRLILPLILLAMLHSAVQSAAAVPPSAAGSPTHPPGAKNGLSYRLFRASGDTWGYDIYTGATLFIHQPVIPGRPGRDGFRRKGDARKTAKLVIKKMARGEMPPAVTEEELKKLKIL